MEFGAPRGLGPQHWCRGEEGKRKGVFRALVEQAARGVHAFIPTRASGWHIGMLRHHPKRGGRERGPKAASAGCGNLYRVNRRYSSCTCEKVAGTGNPRMPFDISSTTSRYTSLPWSLLSLVLSLHSLKIPTFLEFDNMFPKILAATCGRSFLGDHFGSLQGYIVSFWCISVYDSAIC
jgi:hypothetical protein